MPGIRSDLGVCSACFPHWNQEQVTLHHWRPPRCAGLGKDDNLPLVYDIFELKGQHESSVKMPNGLSRKTISMFIIRVFFTKTEIIIISKHENSLGKPKLAFLLTHHPSEIPFHLGTTLNFRETAPEDLFPFRLETLLSDAQMRTKIYFLNAQGCDFQLVSLTSSKRNLGTNHHQPDVLSSAELGNGSMVTDWNSCWRHKTGEDPIHGCSSALSYPKALTSLTFWAARSLGTWKSEANTDRDSPKTYPQTQAKAGHPLS